MQEEAAEKFYKDRKQDKVAVKEEGEARNSEDGGGVVRALGRGTEHKLEDDWVRKSRKSQTVAKGGGRTSREVQSRAKGCALISQELQWGAKGWARFFLRITVGCLVWAQFIEN